MKQVININFQGRVVPIEVTAFDILKDYTESLNRYFAAEEGKEEIINDIENRIGELFQERLSKGATCITDDDVNAIIRSMGRPEEFETEQSTTADAGIKTAAAAAGTEYNYNTSGSSRRLFRDENHKLIGGVCSGLANYFGIDRKAMRIIFLILLFASFGVFFIAYLISWVAIPSSATTQIGSVRKKLYRDPDDKFIAGVCSGIGNYFGINAWIPRVLFLIPFLSFATRWNRWNGQDFGDFLSISFSPGALIVYIILWLVIPEATTTTEKLEMKGEKVDMNSIKNSVMEEMKGVQSRAEKFGQEVSAVAGEKAKAFGAEASVVAKRGGRSLGDVIAFLFKAFLYFIVGCIAFGLVIGLFFLGVGAIGLFPLKDFVLTDGWQNAFAWGTLLFFIATPIIGIITFIIRRIAKVKTNRKAMRISFLGLWLIGVASFILLIASIARDFKSSSSINEQEISLVNPGVSKLEITSADPSRKMYRTRWFRMSPFEGIDEDTAMVKNISVHIVKSPNDSFRVTMIKLAAGKNRRAADTLASLINFEASQMDSILKISKGIQINKTDKFRNQRVILTVYVPVGKQIRVDNSVGWADNVTFGENPWNDEWDIEFDNVEEGWETNIDYVMRADGLYTLDGKPADSYRRRDWERENEVNIYQDENPSTDTFRYDSRGNTGLDGLDSLKLRLRIQEQRTKDSLQKVKDKIEEQLKRIDSNPDGSTSMATPILPAYNPMLIMY